MDIEDFLYKFGIDESSLSDKDRQRLLNAIQNDKNSIAYGVYKKSSVDPISRKVFLDKYNTWKTNIITPQQLANEVTQGTVDKNIGKNMSDYGYYGYSVGKNEDPRQMKSAQQLQQEVITEATQSPNPKSFNWKNEEWQLVNDLDRGYYWMGSAGSVSPKSYSSEAEAYAAMQQAMNTTRPDNGNVNLNNGLGAAPQDPNPGDKKAVDELKRNTWMDKIGSDLKAGGMTSLGIGAGSIALSQMQGNGLVGTGINLAGALGGSVLGNKYLGETLNPTIGRIGGGLAGHTIANLLMGLFRNPSEKQLLDQGMAYAQQQNGGMS